MWEANKIAYRGNSSYKRAYRGSTLIWEAKPLFEGLTFTAEKAGSTVKYTKSTVSSAEYSYDAVNWSNANGVTITLNNVGDKVYFRGQITGNQDALSLNYAHFGMTGLIAASGNINSMNSNSDVLSYSRCYEAMFRNCTSLTKAPELPATTLSGECYHFMLNGCTSLTKAPELPATTLATGCYEAMFYGCTSLTQAPELPATTLVSLCYDSMFLGCTSLTTAPSILPATVLVNSCYWHMFSGCTSLTTVPELPATTLADWCYGYMFRYCASLNKVTTYATSWNTSRTSGWLSGVSSTGDFYNLGDASIPSGTSGIPEGWTEHKTLD